MQLTFPFAPRPRTPKARATKQAFEGLTVAEALNRGCKVAFPRNANAIRVTIDGKTTVVLKDDADTLKGAGVASAVEFGMVKNDSRGHPLRKNFRSWTTAASKRTQASEDADSQQPLRLFISGPSRG